jgi:hypothetical protein
MSWWPKNNSRIYVDHVLLIKDERNGDVDASQIQELNRLGESLRSKTAELAAAIRSAGDKKE